VSHGLFDNEDTWCRHQRRIPFRGIIAPEDHSARRRFDGQCHGRCRARFATFNRWNDERKVNVNRNENDWNDDWWFAGVRKSLRIPPRLTQGRGGVVCICFFQPPSILPTSASGVAIRA